MGGEGCKVLKSLERAKGFEPSTSTLAKAAGFVKPLVSLRFRPTAPDAFPPFPPHPRANARQSLSL